jgi:hypothetical protein
LVEEASALGSAGILVAGTLGLFTPFGGARSAAWSLGLGLVGYLGAKWGGLATPFLVSLGAAALGYLLPAAKNMAKKLHPDH